MDFTWSLKFFASTPEHLLLLPYKIPDFTQTYLACTKTRNNRNETTGPEPPEPPEQESEMTGTTETKIEHDRNKEFEFICKKPELQN
jgi:hypothetical protein